MQSFTEFVTIHRKPFLPQEPERILLASVAFSVTMVLARILYTGSFLYTFLLWNLFLAFIPYAITRWLRRQPKQIVYSLKFSLLAGTWLLFLPNSFYIITDLLHLNGYATIGKWFNLTMIISFAWNGLLLGILSLRQMEKLVEIRMKAYTELFFIYPVALLNALGVYIGRYLRFNSWDVLANPFQLVNDIIYMVAHPLRHSPEWGMIFLFSVFMLLVYKALKRLSQSLV